MLKQLLLVCCLILITGMILMYVFQRHLIYFPSRETPGLKEYQATDFSLITLQTEDNVTLQSWYKSASTNQPTVLFLHGNAGHIGFRMPLARQFINAGLGVLLLEYRGYGGNGGSPSEQGLYADGRAALRFLDQHGVKPGQIVLYGESLGTGIATKLAVEHPFCAVILQSPFTSLVSVARFHYPWIILKPWDHFDSLARIKKTNTPLLVAHGKLDQVVPFSEGLTLYQAANEPKKMLEFGNKNHTDLWEPYFYKEIIKFIQVHCH